MTLWVVIFALFYCLLELRSGECNVVSLYCPVNGSVCFCVACLTVFVNCLVYQFAICLGVFAILLLKVMELCVDGGALLDRPCMVFHRMCVLCLCTQCLLNEKKLSRYTPSNLGLRTSGSSEAAILIFGRVLACAGSGVNKVTLVLISKTSYG